MSDTESERTRALRQLVKGFIQERLQIKLSELPKNSPKIKETIEQHEYDTWLRTIVEKAIGSQKGRNPTKFVTHSVKPIHSSSQGSNALVEFSKLPKSKHLSSHCLDEYESWDTTGNAADSLISYSFLKLKFEGKPLLLLAVNKDPDFMSAISKNPEDAEIYVEAFSQLYVHPPRASNISKQLYWLSGDDCTDDSHYHLLAPLYATSLAHKVFQTINHARFSDESKSARAAYRDKVASDSPVHVYPELATQKLGGTKPQNISQLNSERGGNNYLLASLPPLWESREIRPPLNTSSAFFRFSSRPTVRTGLKELIGLLSADTKSTMHVREHRDKLLDQLIGELILYTHETRQLEPGWSSASECHLPDVQKQWLDPHHYQPELPSSESAVDTWPKEIADTFARWLNQKLKKSLQTGDPEHQYWQTQLQKTLNLLQEDLSYV